MVYPHSYRQKNSETITTSSDYGAYYAYIRSKKIHIQPTLRTLFQWVDTFRKQQIVDLKEMIEIQSISGNLEHRHDVIRMVKLTDFWFTRLGIKRECFNIGNHVIDGQEYERPPIILGQLGSDKNKYTVCIYGHLDVLDPSKQEDWISDPFKLDCRDKCYYGVGVASAKAPIAMWFHAIQAFVETKTELPVNLKFVIEGMHEHHSVGLETLLRREVIGALKGIDFFVVTESNWIGKNLPCLTYGFVGYSHFWITSEKVEGSSTDPKDDLKKLTDSLVGERGTILIKNHDSCVQQITPDEELIYEKIQEFDVRDIQMTLPAYKRGWDKVKVLMYFWRIPGLQIDKIEECTCDKKNNAPAKYKQSFLYKLVPFQIPDRQAEKVDHHFREMIEKHKITNRIECKMVYAERPWVEDPKSAHYEAARRATIQVYKEDPSMIREDRELPILTMLNRVFQKNILVLPLFNSELNYHQANENITERSFFEGTKLMMAYLIQVSYIERLPKKSKS